MNESSQKMSCSYYIAACGPVTQRQRRLVGRLEINGKRQRLSLDISRKNRDFGSSSVTDRISKLMNARHWSTTRRYWSL